MSDVVAEFILRGPDIPEQRVTVPRGELVVGRGQNADLMIDSHMISRRHVRIYWQDGNYWVLDLKSTNGTWLNQDRLVAGVPRKLEMGDGVQMSHYVLIFERLIDDNGQPIPTTQDSNIQGRQEVPALQPKRRELRTRKLGVRNAPPQLPDRLISSVRAHVPIHKLPQERSNWLQYLPAMYSDKALDPTEFVGRYLLVFETMMNRVKWTIDNFDLYLAPETAPQEWLAWLSSWFDMEMLTALPIERQRAILREIGWLYFRRGTKVGLERLLTLYFDVPVTITEANDNTCSFEVAFVLRDSDMAHVGRGFVQHLINSQKPAFASFTLELGAD